LSNNIFFSYFLNAHYKIYYNLLRNASQQTIMHVCQSLSSAQYCQIMHSPYLQHSETWIIVSSTARLLHCAHCFIQKCVDIFIEYITWHSSHRKFWVWHQV